MRTPALLLLAGSLLIPATASAADVLTPTLKRIDQVAKSDKDRAGRMLDELRAEFPGDKLRDHQRMQIGVRLVTLGRLGQAGAVLMATAGKRGAAVPTDIKGVDLEARIAAMALTGRVDEAAETMKGCANASPPKTPCGVFRTVGLVRKFHRPGVAMKLLQAFGDKREGPAQQAGTPPPSAPKTVPAQPPGRPSTDPTLPREGFHPIPDQPAHESTPWWIWLGGIVCSLSLAGFYIKTGGSFGP